MVLKINPNYHYLLEILYSLKKQIHLNGVLVSNKIRVKVGFHCLVLKLLIQRKIFNLVNLYVSK